VSRALAAARRRAALLLLPLSLAPFAAVAPTVMDSHARLQRLQLAPLPAPAVALSPAEAARFRALPATPGRIPALLWHGIGDARDGYTVSRRAFARQLALLDHLGYTAVTMEQWAAFRAGRAEDLPAKPILLTFDDGRLDSYRGADAVLERHGMRAAMFVITAHLDERNPFYTTWEELHEMEESGRWDVEPHAHAGHTMIRASGGKAPFYAARRPGESLARWQWRVTDDVLTARKRFAEQGLKPSAFAVPYGDYGQRTAAHPAIPRVFAGVLRRQFGNFMVQHDGNDPPFTAPGTGAAQRYELGTTTTLGELYRWLRRHSYGARRKAPASRGPAAGHARPSKSAGTAASGAPMPAPARGDSGRERES
jgi:peptidoglycan/xylan/chitin deacetylase (PgdA/CDA1 family)